jgi:hypothetical protein
MKVVHSCCVECPGQTMVHPPSEPHPTAGSRLLVALRSVLVVLTVLVPLGLVGQDVDPAPEATAPLLIPRIDGSIVMDGRLDEPAWDHAAHLDPVMHVPIFGAEPSERTEFLVGHDGEYLYFGCRAYDSDPAGIRAPSLRRNDGRFINDWCVLNLDTLNDGETTLVFGTSPAGIRTDGMVADDAAGPPNFDWNTFWDAEATSFDGGWSAEIRIPFSSLAFQTDDEGRVVMGLTVWRNIARKNERVTHPPISPRWGGFSFLKASQMRPAILEEVQERRAVHVTPYLLGGMGHTHSVAAEGREYLRSEEQVREAGLDVHYGLGPNLSLDLSVNTDFAQVEADDQQVNLDRFSLFFPEKRRFFQERASIFEFPLGGNERLFHSRRVGLADGQPVRIYGGGRLVGRVGDWDLGALNMHTAESDLLPSENKGVVRARRRVLNESSYAGAIVTSRVGTEGSYNLVYGGDARLRLFGQDYLFLNWAQSFDDAETDAAGAADAGLAGRTLLRARWERRDIYGPMYDVDLSRVGEGFEPGLGFLQRRGYTRGEVRLGYGWSPGDDSSVLRYGVGLTTSAFRRSQDGTLETGSLEPSAIVDTRSGHRLMGIARYRHENLARGFPLPGGVEVPEGRYRFSEGVLQYTAPPGDLVQATLRLEGGEFFDGRRTSIQFSPSWTPSRHLGLSASYRLDRVDFPEREDRFTAHVGRLRTEVMVSTEISAVAFVQYNSTLDLVVANVRFRYNPREGDDLYIVWNEGMNANRLDYDPVRPRSDQRTVLIKYSRTFSLGL